MKAIMGCGVIINRKIMTMMKITGNMEISMASQADNPEATDKDNPEANMASLVGSQEAMAEVNMDSLTDNPEAMDKDNLEANMASPVDSQEAIAEVNMDSLTDNQEAMASGKINMASLVDNQGINMKMKEAAHAVEDEALVADMANNLHNAIMAPVVTAVAVAMVALTKIPEGHLAAMIIREEVIAEEIGILAQEKEAALHKADHKMEGKGLTGNLDLLHTMNLLMADPIPEEEVL
jgi:hypothetical protein